MFYNARYYDSSLGRFASPDTIIPEQSQGVQAWDRYAYVNNSPIGNIDPSGHSLPLPPCWLCGLTLSYASSSGLFEEGGALNSVLDMAIPLAGDLLYPGGVDVDPLADTVTFASSEEYYSAQVNSIAAFGVDVVPLEPFFPMTPFDGVIETKSVYYTQDSAKKLFSNGESWIDLAEGLGNGTIDPSSIPPIRIFKDANGKIWTLDNRRLAAFEYAGVDIPYTSITASTVQKESWKFTTQNGGASIRIRDTNIIVSK